jgi:hypothetical protein
MDRGEEFVRLLREKEIVEERESVRNLSIAGLRKMGWVTTMKSRSTIRKRGRDNISRLNV